MIRPTRGQNVPSGRPCILYTLPVVYGSRDCGVDVDPIAVDACKDLTLLHQNKPSDSEMSELFQIIMDDNNMTLPDDVDDAVETYKFLRRFTINEGLQ